jgi:hypothetical protein
MLSTVLDYGISGDAGVQHRWGKRLVRWYATLGNEPRVTDDLDITKYGGFCEIVTQLVVAASPFETWTSRHLANLGFAFAAFLAVLWMGRRLGAPRGPLRAALPGPDPPFYGTPFSTPGHAAGMYTPRSPRSSPATTGAVRFSRCSGGRLVACAAVRVGDRPLRLRPALWLNTSSALRALRAGPPGADLLRLLGAWAGSVAVGWAAMVAFWPWAMLDPLRNPFRAAGRFSRFWEDMLLFYDGRLVPAAEVSRFYLPNWFALTTPELYLVAGALGLVALVLLLRARPLGPSTRLRLLQAAWLGSIPATLVAGVVLDRMPLYDGLRHFLFLFPLLAALAGAGVAAFLRAPVGRPVRVAGVAALALACAVTLVDMARLHPYESVYFNRLWAGGMRAGVARYEGDYFCLSYKEGSEWLLRRFAGARCREPIRVAGHSVLQQTEHYLQKTDEGRQLFAAVAAADGRPHYVLATTRFQDHLRTPGKPVFTVERMGATLLYLFEVRPPDCTP